MNYGSLVKVPLLLTQIPKTLKPDVSGTGDDWCLLLLTMLEPGGVQVRSAPNMRLGNEGQIQKNKTSFACRGRWISLSELIAEPDTLDTEEEEQVSGGSKWLEATAPTTSPKTRLWAEIKPTAHASALTKAAMKHAAAPSASSCACAATHSTSSECTHGTGFEGTSACTSGPPPQQPLSLPPDARHPPPPLAAPRATYGRFQSNILTTPTAQTELDHTLIPPAPAQHGLSSPTLIASPGTINIKNFRGDLSTVLDIWSDLFNGNALDLLLQNIQEVDLRGAGGDVRGIRGYNSKGYNLGGNGFQEYVPQGDNFPWDAGENFRGPSDDDSGGNNMEVPVVMTSKAMTLEVPVVILIAHSKTSTTIWTQTRTQRTTMSHRSTFSQNHPPDRDEAEAGPHAEWEILSHAGGNADCHLTDTGIPQEWVLKRFHASHNEHNVCCPHKWNLYQAYANHEINHITKIQCMQLGANTVLEPEILPPLTMPELKEAYLEFIKACGGLEKVEEILLKHAEWASTEGVTTYEGCQHQFVAVQRCLDGMIGKIEAQDDFQVIYFIGGPHCHQDSQLAGSSYTSGLSEVLIALKSATYDCELKKLHTLKAQGGTPNTFNTTSSAHVTSSTSTSASSSNSVPVKTEHSISKEPHIKHDYSGMTQDEITAAKRKLAAAHHTKAKDATNAVQDHMRAMSISDALDSIDLFKGNRLKWTGITQLLGSKNLRIERYPGGGMVIFSFDYSCKVPPHNSPDYVHHWCTSHGCAVPCADGNGKLWCTIYNLDLPNPIICKSLMALRIKTKPDNATALVVEKEVEEEEVVVVPKPRKAKGKAKWKVKGKEWEEEVLEVEVVVKSRKAKVREEAREEAREEFLLEEDMAPAPMPEVEILVQSRKAKGKAKAWEEAREEAREELESEEDTAPALKRQQTGASGSSAPKHPATSAGCAHRPTTATSKSSAHTSISEPPAKVSHHVTRKASAAAAAQEQVGGGAVGKKKSQKKAMFNDVPFNGSDSDSGKFVPLNSKSGEEDYSKGKGKCRTLQEFFGMVYSAQDSQPIGKAYVCADGSYVGEFTDNLPPPNLPLPAKHSKAPVPPPASPPAPAVATVPANSGGLLSNLVQMMAQLPPQMLMQAMSSATSLQQQQQGHPPQ
ncbi:hypothetical protein DFH08DRAFT_817099 [Mycena albidolilacea]|uniref:Uncharacterized protein n=1 Tax=Mycena albidolilacea TaxID=1033008 RepID=A0AAD6ZIP8_9AGAR|nr:hypothetical protein DFH08DRAFT_817099 [Mycena albidolilacea]